MINIKEIKGLKYPDEYFIKFFFKNRLHEKKDLTYLEFGCGNGSNLMLPYSYGGGNKVIGIDYDSSLISMANDNFSCYKSQDNDFKFHVDDMREFVKSKNNLYCDSLSLPNIINYISKNDFINFLVSCKDNRLYKENAYFFIRFRTPKDFRYGLGRRIGENSYQINSTDDTTGEAGAMNTFYRESEMLKILEQYINIKDYKVFNIDFENQIANGDTILNSDIVIWGTIN